MFALVQPTESFAAEWPLPNLVGPAVPRTLFDLKQPQIRFVPWGLFWDLLKRLLNRSEGNQAVLRDEPPVTAGVRQALAVFLVGRALHRLGLGEGQ